MRGSHFSSQRLPLVGLIFLLGLCCQASPAWAEGAPTPQAAGELLRRMVAGYASAKAFDGNLAFEQENGGRLIELAYRFSYKRPNVVLYRMEPATLWMQGKGFTFAADRTRLFLRGSESQQRTITLPAPATLEEIEADPWWTRAAGFHGLICRLLIGRLDWPTMPLDHRQADRRGLSQTDEDMTLRFSATQMTLQLRISREPVPRLLEATLEATTSNRMPIVQSVRVVKEERDAAAPTALIQEYIDAQIERGTEGWPIVRFEERKRFPNFRLLTVGGAKVDLGQLKGAPATLLFRWSIDRTGTILRQLETIERLREAFKSRGIRVLTVNGQDSFPSIEGFMQRNRLEVPVLLDPHGAITGAMPQALTILDREGAVISALPADHPYLEHMTRIAIEHVARGRGVEVVSAENRRVEVRLSDIQGRPWEVGSNSKDRMTLLVMASRRTKSTVEAVQHVVRALRALGEADLPLYVVAQSHNPYQTERALRQAGLEAQLLVDVGDASRLMREARMLASRRGSVLAFRAGGTFLGELTDLRVASLTRGLSTMVGGSRGTASDK